MDRAHTGWGNAILENTGVLNGGCGEGTIFTFTSGHKAKPEDPTGNNAVSVPQGRDVGVANGNGNGAGHLQKTLTVPVEACLPARRFHSRRSKSPCRIRIDFKELLAQNATKGPKLRGNLAEDKALAAGQNGMDRRKLDWNDKAKQLAELFDSRNHTNLGIQQTGKMHVLQGTIAPGQAKLQNVEEITGKDQIDARLSEMASRIREQEASRAILARENALLKEQLERIRSGELRQSSNEPGQANEIAKDTGKIPANGVEHQPQRSRSRKEKLRRSKSDGTDDRKSRLSMEKLIGERSHMIDKRRSMKAWLRSGYFDFSGAQNRASPMARSFISFKAGLSSVGRKPYILRFKRKEKVGPQGSKLISRNRKEDCNGHGSVLSEDLTAWTEDPPVKLSSSPPEFSTKAHEHHLSGCEEKYVGDAFKEPEAIALASKDCDGEVVSGAAQSVGHSALINRTIAEITCLFQDEQTDQEKVVQLQREEDVQSGVSNGGTEENNSAEASFPQDRQELQISAWVSDVLASVEQKHDLDLLEHNVGQSNTGAWETSESEPGLAPEAEAQAGSPGLLNAQYSTAPVFGIVKENGVHLEPGLAPEAEAETRSPGLLHSQYSTVPVPEFGIVKGNGVHIGTDFKIVQTGIDPDDSGLRAQATGIKAMLKDFHMKERLTRLRRMPVLFRSKKSAAYSWLRLSHENKSLMLQQVASSEVLQKEVLFLNKQEGKLCGRRSDDTDLSGDGATDENPEPLEECLPAKEVAGGGGFQESGQSREGRIPQYVNGYSSIGERAILDPDCKHPEPLESGQLMTCCSAFGSLRREKIYSVEDDRQDSVQPVARLGTEPTNGTVDKQEGSRSIFGKSKMRGILGFRKDKEQTADSHGYSYTSLSLIVGNEEKLPKKAINKSGVKMKLKGCDSSQEDGSMSNTMFTEDADSPHDSAQEDEAGVSNPVSLVEKCTVLDTLDPPGCPSSYKEARSGLSLQDTLKDETNYSVESRTTQSTNQHVLLSKHIAPAEQVFLARYSTISVDESRQSSSSMATDPPACRAPAEPSSVSALTSLLLLDTPQRSAEVTTWSQPLRDPEPSAYTFGVRCGTAPCPSLAKEDGALHQPFDVSARPTTASGNCLQGSKSSFRNYNPSPYSPRTLTLDPVSHHRSGYPFCSQTQSTSSSVCSLSTQRTGIEKSAFPESCGPVLSRISTQMPHHLARQQPCVANPWVCVNQNQSEHALGSSHLLGHSCESQTELCPSETSFNHDQETTTGCIPNASGLHSACTGHQHEHSKYVSSGMYPYNRKGYKVSSETQQGISHPYDTKEMNVQEFSSCNHPSVVPYIAPSATCNQQSSIRRVQGSLNQESAFLLRKQCQVGHNGSSFPGQYRATEPQVAFADTFGADIPSAPNTHPLHESIVPPVGNCVQQLLWLSEEETEIIRQMRVSKGKGIGLSPCISLSAQQAINPKADGPDNNEVIGSYHRRAVSHCSNLSSCSADDSVLHFDDSRSVKDSDASWKKVAEYDKVRRSTENKRQLAMQEKQTKMVIAACRHSAAACIQQWWKKCLHQKAVDLEEYHEAALKLSKIPGWLHQFPDIKLRTAATISRVTHRRKWVQRKYNCLQRAAITIQRWWRNLNRQKRQIPTSSRKLPNNMKGLYTLVKSRHLSRGVIAPTYDRFLKLVERVQAATEGARVRGRLKSRRLQAMIMEIKEIRALLVEMSLDTSRETPPNFVPQLYNQLQQKMLQLRTALTGPERDARFVLRRSPASPLVIVTTRPGQSAPAGAGQRSGDKGLLKSTSSSLADTLNAVNDQLPGGNDKATLFAPSKKSQISQRILEQSSIDDTPRPVRRKFVELAYSQIYQHNNRGAPPTNTRADEELQRFSQTEITMHEIHLQLNDSAGSEEQFYETEYVEDPNRPKRPYLKRKSVMMAPQKLDWSKVKPMVRSRLEPELRTKMTQNKSKGVNVSSTSRKVTKNYSKVKSRLFNYERKGSSFEASASSSKAAAGDADLSEFAEVRQWNEARKLEREHRASIESGESSRKVSNNLTNRPSDSLRTGGKMQTKTASEPPAPTKVDGGSKQKVENKVTSSRQHSNRYGSSGDAPQAKKENIGHQNSSEEMAKPVSEATSKQGWVASVELENMFKGVMSLKNEKGIYLNGLFRPIQGKSVVPRLNPSAYILNTSVEERNMLFDVLWKQGRSNRVSANGATRP